MNEQLKEIIVKSPGRINLIGDHTDYMGGFVLPAAIGNGITVRIRENNSQHLIKVFAEDVSEHHNIDLRDINAVRGGWRNYVIGTIAEVNKLRKIPSGFDVSFSGDVPIGSGMSSSAALECSLAFAINEFFELGLEKIDLIKAGQMAEHNYVGTKCGIMDQFVSVMGKKDQALFLDCMTLDYQYFPLNLGDYKIVLLNTKVSHSLADSEYNLRRKTCEQGLEILQKYETNVLTFRDINMDILDKHKAKLQSKMYDRCKHVVLENERVLAATKALSANDIPSLGKLMNQSHISLSTIYDVSCEELDFLYLKASELPTVLGSRMMGGGFGGCTINIVHQDTCDQFIQSMSEAYETKFGIVPEAYRVSIEDGTHIISSK